LWGLKKNWSILNKGCFSDIKPPQRKVRGFLSGTLFVHLAHQDAKMRIRNMPSGANLALLGTSWHEWQPPWLKGFLDSESKTGEVLGKVFGEVGTQMAPLGTLFVHLASQNAKLAYQNAK
jgi:hypothetical protein